MKFVVILFFLKKGVKLSNKNSWPVSVNIWKVKASLVETDAYVPSLLF